MRYHSLIINILIVFALLTNISVGMGEPAKVTEQPQTADLNTVVSDLQSTCSAIYQGHFDQAEQQIHQFTKEHPDANTLAAPLKRIIDEYRAIEQHRQQLKLQAYQEQIEKLDKMQKGIDSNDVNDLNDPNLTGAKDVNEIKEIVRYTKVLSVIAKAVEYAEPEQKKTLFDNPYVKETIQGCIDQASRYEAEGNWMDAYLVSYSWLQVIDKDNKAYQDYAEELLDKAAIVASFQDSPCETRQQRYEGVSSRIFERAVKVLNFNYVEVLDYRQMFIKSIERCKLLAEVVARSYDQITEDASSDEEAISQLKKPTENQIAAWTVGLAALQSEADTPLGISSDKFIDLYKKVLELNKVTIELPPKVLIAQFSEAALLSLDPYTQIVWPKQVEDFEKLMMNEFTGIGVEISKQKGLLTVASLLLGTPAYRSGLDAGDIIEKVDGEETKDMSLTCAVKRITGPKGTEVRLTVRHPGQVETEDIVITRDKITVPTIRGWLRSEKGQWMHMVDESAGIGYVRISNFSERTTEDFKQVLDRLEAAGMKGLILDLRYNTGGLLPVAVDITDMFVSEGRIVTTQPRFGIPTYEQAKKSTTRADYPLVVLINAGSASASEIVAGALADKTHERATLVGKRTHGKGSVQGITNYTGDGSQLKYTMAYYLLPSGQRVKSQSDVKKNDREDWGVAPDVQVELRTNEIRKLIDIQRDNDVLARADHEANGEALKKHTIDETINADPQLKTAILVMKTKLFEQELGQAK